MRVTLRFTIGFLVCAVLLPTVFTSEAFGQSRRMGTLVLEVDQEGAEVFVDGESVGISPIEPLELERGEHTVRVSRPGYTEFTSVVEIQARREQTLLAELFPVSMALMVLSQPEGAQVFVDGNFVGEAPVEVELDEGQHQLRLEARGFHDHEQAVEAVLGSDDVLSIDLEPLPLEVRRALQEEQEPGIFEQPLFWGIAAGVVAAAIVVSVVIVVLVGGGLARDEFCEMSPSGQCHVTLAPGLEL